MPTYRLETLERWPHRVVYEVTAVDMLTAMQMVAGQQVEPKFDDEHFVNESDQIVEFISCERIDGDPLPQPTNLKL
jgi:hypothetical protein